MIFPVEKKPKLLIKSEPLEISQKKSCRKIVLLVLLGLIVSLFATCSRAHAFSDEQAIRAIIGEAANQGEIGMTAVAEVIRTRGSLKGIYGYKASHVDKQPAWVWKQARRAWYASKTTNYTRGAQHFENIKAFGCPYWVKDCYETFRYKDHVFYKRRA